MSRTFTDSNGVTLIIPDSSVTTNVVSQPTGIATTGVIALVGEADQGSHWSEEEKLSDNSFGPLDLARVVSKYGSGRLVDGFRGLIGASSGPRIQGSFSRAILVKPNLGNKASKATDDGHGTLKAKLAGAPGNNIKETISADTAEAAPTTGSFSYVPSASSSSLAARVNGGAKQTLAISADQTPASLASAITGLANLNAVGGVDRVITSGLSIANSVAVAVVSGQNVTITLTAPAVWGASPQVGDTVRIPLGSVIAGVANANVGWYLVTASSNTATLAQISAKKITAGAPVAVSAVAFSATPASDIVDYSYMRIDNMSGRNRDILSALVGQSAAVTVAASALTFTLVGSNVFSTKPRVGDIVYIPSGSAFAGAGSANVGWYQITASSNFATAAFFTASRLSNGSPVAVASTPIVATTDIQDYDRQIRGSGKALELYDNAGTVNVNTVLKQLGADSAASWLEVLTTSSAELKKRIDLSKPNPLVTESFIHGGNIVLQLGYKGTTAIATVITSSGIKKLQTTVTGGVGANLDITLSNYNSISDLVDFLNLQPGYNAAAHSSQEAQRNPSQVLDEVSAIGIDSDLSNRPGRIKRDIYDMTAGLGNIAQNSVLVTYVNILKAGLPEDEGPAFLSGGAKGATTGLAFSQAIDALANVRCNFVVPLASRDASVDSANNETDAASTYTVDAINAAVKTHCINMSTPKVKRHRIGFVSKKGTFSEAKASAQTMASFRIAHTFEDAKDLDSNANISTFQPWMASCKAAGMQAAGFYRSIFNKAINISGIVNPSGFDDQSQSLCEDAVSAGLLVIQRQEDGTFTFLSDQLTYGLDNNFVYNSIQAVYVADIISLTLAESLKKAFVGESVADVTPSVAISFTKGKMAEFLDKKLIVGSSKFPSGWKNIQVTIADGVMAVRCVVIEATSIYFIPINVDIEGLRDSAAA